MIIETRKIEPLIDKLEELVDDYVRDGGDGIPESVKEAFSLAGVLSSTLRVESALNQLSMDEESMEQAIKFIDLALKAVKSGISTLLGEKEQLYLTYNIGKIYQKHGHYERANQDHLKPVKQELAKHLVPFCNPLRRAKCDVATP